MTKTICNSLIEHTQMVATNKSSQCEIFHQYVMEFMVRLYRVKKKETNTGKNVQTGMSICW